jgi:hypothetical protein
VGLRHACNHGRTGTYLVTRDSRLVSRISDLGKTFSSPQSKEYREARHLPSSAILTSSLKQNHVV